MPSLVKVASADDVEMHADPRAWNARHAASGRRLGAARRIALRVAWARLLRARRFVALNRTIARQLEAAGVPGARILALPNGVDVVRHRPATAMERAQARAEHGIADGALCLVVVGRLVASKDVATLVAAVGALPPGPALELRIAGAGPERARLERDAASLPAWARARFVGERTDVAGLLRAADVYLSASRTEGLPNAMLEALASGLACILSDVPGHSDTSAGREHALFVPVGQVVAFSAAIARLRSDAALRSELATRARAAACEVFSLDALARRYAALYEELREEACAGAAAARPGA